MGGITHLSYLKNTHYNVIKNNIISGFFFKKKETELVKLLGYFPKNKVYRTAFIHKSAEKKENNERLEFLGDTVLSSIITELLFVEHKNKKEGFLSKKRATIVGRKHLNLIGEEIIPKNTIKSRLHPIPKNIFGNTLEAIIGAIYVDKGLKQTTRFVKKHIYKSKFLKRLENTDFKSELLKYSQKEKLKIMYRLEREGEEGCKKFFVVGVFIGGKKMAEAKGFSKKEAEQIAAQKTIKKIGFK